jgi:hypothetical protein
MPTADQSRQREICVFSSSTFRAMQEECDRRVTVFLSELRERAEQSGLEFIDVDPCWSVRDEAALDGRPRRSACARC